MDWSNKLQFKVFTNFCEKLEKLTDAKIDSTELKESKKKKRVRALEKFLEMCEEMMKENGVDKDSLFPVIRLLLPGSDKCRGAYGFKQTGDTHL